MDQKYYESYKILIKRTVHLGRPAQVLHKSKMLAVYIPIPLPQISSSIDMSADGSGMTFMSILHSAFDQSISL